MKLKRGEIKVMPPPGTSGASGFSGYSGKSGFSGYSGKSGFSGPQGEQGIQGLSGFSGAAGGGPSFPTDPSGNITITGSLTTGSGSTTTGDIAFSGAVSGAVHLTVGDDAGTGIFYLPNTTGSQTLATLADIAALRAELGLP